jgi:hypothetical protein
MKRNKLLLGVAIVFLLSAVVCGIYLQNLSSQVSWSPSKYPLEQATWILQAIEAKTAKPLRNNLPTKIGFFMTDNALDECWNVLQEAMARNDDQYTLRVAKIYDDGTLVPGSFGSTQVIIEVAFPDGIPLQMEYYASFLVACNKVNDNK